MKVLFLNPISTQKKHLYNVRGNFTHLFNMTLLYLASFLTQRGVSCRIVDLGMEKRHYREVLKDKIQEYHPDFVVIGIRWYFELYGSFKIAEYVKSINKDIIVVGGGQTASYFDVEILQNSQFDFIIRGDAEIPLLNLVKNKELMNLTYKKDNKILRLPLKYIQTDEDIKGYSLIKDVNEILENDKKVLQKTGNWTGEFIWTGKGCNYNCFYCSGCQKNQFKLFGRQKPIFRDVDSVISDINILSDYNKKIVFDFDPVLEDKSFYYKLFKKIGKSDLSLTFYSWTLPPEKLLLEINKTFSSSTLSLSVEACNENFRKKLASEGMLRPFFTNYQLEKMLGLLKENKQFFQMCLIAGLPGENDDIFNSNIDYCKKLLKEYSPVFLLDDESLILCQPLSAEPGSDLSINPDKFGMQLFRKEFKDFYGLSKETFLKNEEYSFGSENSKFEIITHPYGVANKGSSEKDVNKKVMKFYRSLKQKRILGKLKI